MVVIDTSKVKCLVCKKRGDIIGRKNMRSFNEESLISRKQNICEYLSIDPSSIKENSVICTKHLIEFYKNNKSNNFNSQQIELNDHIDINNNQIIFSQSNTDPNNKMYEEGLIFLNNNNLNNIVENQEEINDQYDSNSSSDEQDDDDVDDDSYYCLEDKNSIESEELILDINRTVISNKSCFVCKANSKDINLKSISKDGIVEVFIQKKILIKENSRCCEHHLKNGYLKDEDIEKLNVYSSFSKMEKKDVEKLIEKLRLHGLKNRNTFSQFEKKDKIDAEICHRTTGLYLDEFLSLYNQVESIKDSPSRTKSQCIAIYLFWLKTGLDQATISSYFGQITRNKVKNYCSQMRKALIKDFVPKYLGSNIKDR